MSKKLRPGLQLGVASLVMITVGSVDSIRNLPTTALFGSTLIFYFILAALLFLLPSALVSAELASTSAKPGGIYSWVKQVFGPGMGFLAVWFQWTENVIWYPTILSFVAGSLGYLISPDLAQNRYFLIAVILVAFWGATGINLLGIRSSARFASFAAVCGLLLPMALIIGLGTAWYMSGQPLAIHLNWHTAIPGLHESHMWVALTGVIMSYCGMEIATVHGQDVNDPQRAYPRAMLYATLILLVTLIGGSLAIAIVLPNDHISLVAGIMQAFSAFFTAYHMAWILPLIAVMLVIGGMGGVSNWIIAPTRGLELAARDGSLPRHCRLENRYGAPVALLLYQAVIASLMTGAFLWMPSVNASYWLLTVLAAQQYMLMYMIMFVTAILWRYRDFSKLPGYRIGGGRYGMCFVAGTGFVGSLLTFFIGFIPPHDMNTGGFWHYEGSLLLGLVVMLVLPLLLRRYTQAAEAKRTL